MSISIFRPLIKSLKEFFGEGHKVCTEVKDGMFELSITTQNPDVVEYVRRRNARERKKFAIPTILVMKLSFKISGEKFILVSEEWNEFASEYSEFWNGPRDIVIEFLYNNRDKIMVPSIMQGGE